MDWTYLVAAVAVAVVVSGIIHGLLALWLRRSILRELAAPAGGAYGGGTHADAELGHPEQFAEIAPELVNLARNATGTAIRQQEVHEWHQLDLFPLGSDDISEAVRDKLRRASFDAVAARSALVHAVRRHSRVIPAALEADLRSFADQLEPSENGSRPERKRRLAVGLDTLESRLRETLGADLLGGAGESDR